MTSEARTKQRDAKIAVDLGGSQTFIAYASHVLEHVLEIPPTKNPVLYVVPDILASNKSKITELWEAPEHVHLGNKAVLKFGSAGPATCRICLPNGLQLTYGEILALSGDFYGDPRRSISDDQNPPTRFCMAFDSLASGSPNRVRRILDLVKNEGRAPSTFKYGVADPLYVPLALSNWDHFGRHAIYVYEVGHRAALENAILARSSQKANACDGPLALAYAMNAFADHFLTDLFSAGHIRTPREELSKTVGWLRGSYLAWKMHDEDSCLGLKVQNSAGDHWEAYGDKRLFDVVNRRNCQITIKAVQASVDDIWQAFSTGAMPTTFSALKYIPDLAHATDRNDRQNFAALFICDEDQTISQRANLFAPHDHKWNKSWTVLSTIFSKFKPCGSTELPLRVKLNPVAFAGDQSGDVREAMSLLSAAMDTDRSFDLPPISLELIGDGHTRVRAQVDRTGVARFGCDTSEFEEVTIRLETKDQP